MAEPMLGLCAELGLDFAAADLKLDESTGLWYFLEVNSNPMFAAFDQAGDGNLCAEMIRYFRGR